MVLKPFLCFRSNSFACCSAADASLAKSEALVTDVLDLFFYSNFTLPGLPGWLRNIIGASVVSVLSGRLRVAT